VSPTYVEQRDGRYVVTDTRVSLDSIVYGFLSGQSAESLAQAFPVLTLEQVYGAIAFYLGHRDELDRYLDARRQDFKATREAARDADPMFYQKLTDAKKHIPFVRWCPSAFKRTPTSTRSSSAPSPAVTQKWTSGLPP
jgi:uncharacterized protein (DUF433 family)